MGAVVMLLGTGHLGGAILDRLAASASIARVVAVGRDVDRGERRCNLARLAAMSGGRTARVLFRAADLERRGEVAALVGEVAPDLVIHSASLQTWWLADLLPAPSRARLRRLGYGPWVSLHLALALAVSRELADAGYRGGVFNAAYPDVVNVVLGRLGRPPTGGLGNIDELVAKVRIGAATRLHSEPRRDRGRHSPGRRAGAGALGVGDRVEVRLVAHHALLRFAFAAAGDTGQTSGGAEQESAPVPPFHLRISCAGEDIGERIGADELLLEPCPLPGGPAWGIFSAAAAVTLVEAWLRDEPSVQHCAGPEGLPGGYPVRVGNRSVTRVDVPGISIDEAVLINERAQRFDGIEKIGDDGTIEVAAAAAADMQELLGFDCRRLEPADAAAGGRELAERFRRFAAAQGVDLDVARHR